MFKKFYKEANDDISPKRELIDRIFETAESENDKKKAKIYTFIPKYSTVVAAALILVIASAAYPQIKDYDKKLVSVETTNKESVIEENTADTASYTAQEGKKTFDYSKSTATPESLPSGEVSNEKASKARIIDFDSSAEDNTSYEILPEDLMDVTEEDAKNLTVKLIERFGTADTQTGNEFIFEILGKAEFMQNHFYIVRWRWLVDDHSSLLTTLAVTKDADEIYECIYTDGKFFWTNEDSLAD